MKRLLDYDPMSGLHVYHDVQDGKTVIEHFQDCEPTVELNKARMRAAESKREDEMRHVAAIPPGVQMKWLQDYGVWIYNKNHKDKVKALLNSNEWEYLRTHPSRL